MGDCPICWQYKSLCTFTMCDHQVCHDCLQMQLRKDARCALCRKVIVSCTPPFAEAKYDKKITCHLSHKLGVYMKNGEEGVEITRLVNNSLAFKHGLKKGDVILSLNKLPCFTHQRFSQILTACRDSTIELCIKRDDDAKITTVKKKCFWKKIMWFNV